MDWGWKNQGHTVNNNQKWALLFTFSLVKDSFLEHKSYVFIIFRILYFLFANFFLQYLFQEVKLKNCTIATHWL